MNTGGTNDGEGGAPDLGEGGAPNTAGAGGAPSVDDLAALCVYGEDVSAGGAAGGGAGDGAGGAASASPTITIKTHPILGQYLADGDGRTLYIVGRDNPGDCDNAPVTDCVSGPKSGSPASTPIASSLSREPGNWRTSESRLPPISRPPSSGMIAPAAAPASPAAAAFPLPCVLKSVGPGWVMWSLYRRTTRLSCMGALPLLPTGTRASLDWDYRSYNGWSYGVYVVRVVAWDAPAGQPGQSIEVMAPRTYYQKLPLGCQAEGRCGGTAP